MRTPRPYASGLLLLNTRLPTVGFGSGMQAWSRALLTVRQRTVRAVLFLFWAPPLSPMCRNHRLYTVDGIRVDSLQTGEIVVATNRKFVGNVALPTAILLPP